VSISIVQCADSFLCACFISRSCRSGGTSELDRSQSLGESSCSPLMAPWSLQTFLQLSK
jgi:hypothetical protein